MLLAATLVSPVARGGDHAVAPASPRGVIAFNCESCPNPPISTIRWNAGRLQLRGERYFTAAGIQGPMVRRVETF
jgi:hypothetical protein